MHFKTYSSKKSDLHGNLIFYIEPTPKLYLIETLSKKKKKLLMVLEEGLFNHSSVSACWN